MSRLSAARALPSGTVVADENDRLWTLRDNRAYLGRNGTSRLLDAFVLCNHFITIIARPDGRDVGKVI